MIFTLSILFLTINIFQDQLDNYENSRETNKARVVTIRKVCFHFNNSILLLTINIFQAQLDNYEDSRESNEPRAITIRKVCFHFYMF